MVGNTLEKFVFSFDNMHIALTLGLKAKHLVPHLLLCHVLCAVRPKNLKFPRAILIPKKGLVFDHVYQRRTFGAWSQWERMVTRVDIPNKAEVLRTMRCLFILVLSIVDRVVAMVPPLATAILLVLGWFPTLVTRV